MALITTLLDTPDNSETVRDQIATILALEVANQKVLAAAAMPAQDPRIYDLRVFVERFQPWEAFKLPDGVEQLDIPPLVNIAVDNINYSDNRSNTVKRQMATVTYDLDVFALGIAEDVYQGGFIPGDQRAGEICQRAIRYVRQILMAGPYTYLGLPRGADVQFVWNRRVGSIEFYDPQINNETIQQIKAARFKFEVDMNEFSPQVTGEALEIIDVTVTRESTGEVLINANYDYS